MARHHTFVKAQIKQGLDFQEETIAASLRQLRNAERIVLEGNARFWLINDFFRLHKRRWKYLLETLTGGHRALERLLGSVIATLAIGRNRRTFEVREEDAEELFNVLWENNLLLSPEHSERILRQLHQAVINSEAYEIFTHVAVLCHGLELSANMGNRFKSFAEAEPLLELLDSSVHAVIAYDLNEAEMDFFKLKYPLASQKHYALFLKKLESFLKLEVEIHRIVEELFQYVTDTFADLMLAYKIQKKGKTTSQDKERLKKIARKHITCWLKREIFSPMRPIDVISGESTIFSRDAGSTEKRTAQASF